MLHGLDDQIRRGDFLWCRLEGAACEPRSWTDGYSAYAEKRYGVIRGINLNWICLTMDKHATESETAESWRLVVTGNVPVAQDRASTIKLGP